MARSLLAAAFKKSMEEKRLTIAKVASGIGIKEGTFKSWMGRNRFTREDAEAIARLLGWEESINEIERQYEYGGSWIKAHTKRQVLARTGTLSSAFRAIDAASLRTVKPSLEMMTRNILKLYESMDKKDLCILLSATVTPWELDDHGNDNDMLGHNGPDIMKAIAEGAKKGATYLYLRPCQDLLNNYRNVWKFHRFREATGNFLDEIDHLRNFLAREFENDGLDKDEARRRSIRATPQYFVRKDFPFLAPGFTVLMFRAGGYAGSEEDRMIVRLPDNAWAIAYLPVAVNFSERFHLAVSMVLGDEERKLRKRREKLDGRAGQEDDPGCESVESWELENGVLKHIKHILES